MSEPVNPNYPPTNSFGGNPPLPQHQPGNASPEFYGQQTPQTPAPKKSRAGIIAGAAIAGLLVLGGGAYAVTSVMNVAGDKDIAKAAPSNTSAFLQVDLNPSNNQKAAALSVATKIDALVDDKDKYDTEGKDFKEIATDPAFEDLDYKTEVEPWIGDKVAVAGWGDFASQDFPNPIRPGVDDYDYYDEDTQKRGPVSGYKDSYDSGYESDPYDDYYDDAYLDGAYDDLDKKGTDSGVDITVPDIDRVSHTDKGMPAPKKESKKDDSIVLIYEVKNKDKAEEAAKKVIEKDDSIGAYTLHGSYLVLAENDEIISDYIDSIEKGDLSVNETYVSDMKELGGDNIATGWLDLSKMGIDGYLQNIGYGDDGEEIRGRVATGVSLVNEGITSKTKVIGLEGYETLTKNVSDAKGVTDIENFSKDSVVAVTIAGLPEFAAAALEEYEKTSPDSADSFRQSAKEAGFNFPDDFKKIFGSETGIGYTPEKSGNEASVEYRAKGADEGTIKDLLKEAGSSAGKLDVSKDGDTTVVKYSGGSLSTDKLSSHEKFNDALKDLDKSNGAAFVDLDALEESNKKSEKEDKDYGVLGMTSSHDSEKNVSDFTVRWIF
jgi:hypothetical protein